MQFMLFQVVRKAALSTGAWRTLRAMLLSLVGAVVSTSQVHAATEASATNSPLSSQYHGYYNLLSVDNNSFNVAAAPQNRALTLHNVEKVYASDGSTIQALAVSGFGSGSTAASHITTDELPNLNPKQFGFVLEFRSNAPTETLLVGGTQTPWFELKLSGGQLVYSFRHSASSMWIDTKLPNNTDFQGTWNRVAMQFDLAAGIAQMSINGSEVSSHPIVGMNADFSNASKRLSTSNDETSSAFSGQVRALRVFAAGTDVNLAIKSRRSVDSGFLPDFAFPPLANVIHTPDATGNTSNYAYAFPAAELPHPVTLSVLSGSADVCQKHAQSPSAILLKGAGDCLIKATMAITTRVLVSAGSCSSVYNPSLPGYQTVCSEDVTETRTTTREVTATLKVTSHNAPSSISVSPVPDITKAVLSAQFAPAGRDIGKPGAVYVALIHAGNVFFMDAAGEWSLYVGHSPADYYTGTLSPLKIDILKTATDLTSLKGAQIIVGYGVGQLPLNDPFKNMLDNVTYSVAYTIP